MVVNLEKNEAGLSYNPAVIDMIDLRNAITEAGYSVPTQKTILKVTGMSCVSCVAHVEGALQDLPGVINAVVNLSQGKTQVQYIPEVVTITQMEHAVRDAGYDAYTLDPDGNIFEHKQNARVGEISHPDANQKAAGAVGLFAWIKKAFNKPGAYKG